MSATFESGVVAIVLYAERWITGDGLNRLGDRGDECVAIATVQNEIRHPLARMPETDSKFWTLVVVQMNTHAKRGIVSNGGGKVAE